MLHGSVRDHRLRDIRRRFSFGKPAARTEAYPATSDALERSAICIGMQRAAELLPERRACLHAVSAELAPVRSPAWVGAVAFGAAVLGLIATLGLHAEVGVKSLAGAPTACRIEGEQPLRFFGVLECPDVYSVQDR